MYHSLSKTRFTHQKYCSLINFGLHHYQSTTWFLAIPLHTYLPSTCSLLMHIVCFIFVGLFVIVVFICYSAAIVNCYPALGLQGYCLIDWLSLSVTVQVVQEYERAVIFRLGRIVPGGAKGPGEWVSLLRDMTDVQQKMLFGTGQYKCSECMH